MAFHSGDRVGAVVADVGHYATKIGWAGDDSPRSYFRSNVAVLKEDVPSKDTGKRRAAIQKVNYDYYTRYIDSTNNTDGHWQVCNPVNTTTGLWYDPKSEVGADWYDLFQQFIPHAYSTALGNASVDEHPLVLVERSYNPPPIRQQVVECLFEELNVPAAFLSKDAVLSCYGCGRTTATVVDIGYSGTTVTPVHDGYAEPKGIRRSPTGVGAMDEFVLHKLDEIYNKQKNVDTGVVPLYQVRGASSPRSPAIHTAARLQIAQECRELGAGAAINLTAESSFQAPHKPFVLPDGTIVNVPSAVRFAAADLLFSSNAASVAHCERLLEERKKELNALITQATTGDDDEEMPDDEKFSEAAAVGISKRRTKRGANKAAVAAASKKRPVFNNRHLLKACAPHLQTLLDQQLTSSPVAAMVCDAAYRCDRDQQAALLGNVILGGGGSCLGHDQAVPELLREQVETIIHTHTPGWRVKVLTPAIPERAILSWLGGSILGSLGTFSEMYITKAEYEEWGTAIVNRKCP